MDRVFEKGYNIVFNRRNTQIKVISFILVILLPSINCVDIVQYFNNLLFYMGFVGILSILNLAIINNRNIAVSLSTFTVALSIIIDKVVQFVLSESYLLIGVLTLMSFIIPSITLYIEEKERKYSKFLVPLLILTLVLILQFPYSIFSEIHYPKLILADMIALLSSILSTIVLFKIISHIGGPDAFKALSGLIRTVTLGSSRVFEKILEKLSIRRDIEIHQFLVRIGHELWSIVIPNIHTGPLKSIGSSSLISYLSRKFNHELKVPLVYLHGVGSHELDVVTRQDLERIVDSVVSTFKNDLLDNDKDVNTVFYKPVQRRNNGIRVTTLPINDKIITIISRENKASDDIPLNVFNKVKNEIDNNLIIVDAQNHYSQDNSWTNDDIENLKMILKNIKFEKCSDYKLGISKIPADNFGDQYEIGSNGVDVIIVQCDDIKELIVIFDGNNIVDELVEKIKEKFKNTFNIIEVLTTDNHELTGVGRGRGYRLVGESIPHEHILNTIANYVEKTLKKLQAPKTNYRKIVIKNVKVLGEEGFERLRKIAMKSVKAIPIFVLVMFILPVTLTTTTLIAIHFMSLL